MEFSPRLFSRVGGALWKIKFDFTREYAVMTMKFSPMLFSRMGGPLENKFRFYQGIRRHDHGILTKAILACGEGLWKIIFDLTREYAIMTMEFSPRLFSRVRGGSLKNKI